jgi:hypothetical protein
MDAFEALVSEVLWSEGYWVRQSFKVELTKKEKVSINRPSNARWELDIVAYSGKHNLLRVVECKSYLDSPGVRFSGFNRVEGDKGSDRYKLFNEPNTRRVVFKRLQTQLAHQGWCPESVEPSLCLACGRFRTPSDEAQLRARFQKKKKGWELWGPDWLRNLHQVASRSYENEVSAVVAKLLLRKQVAKE